MTTRAIFQRYPELEGHLAWQSLADLPTPVQPLPGTANGWIKRDDLTHAAYGGNKVRKLEFVIAEMQARGVKTAESDKQVDDKFVSDHLRIGIDALKQLINQGLTVKHLRF